MTEVLEQSHLELPQVADQPGPHNIITRDIEGKITAIDTHITRVVADECLYGVDFQAFQARYPDATVSAVIADKKAGNGKARSFSAQVMAPEGVFPDVSTYPPRSPEGIQFHLHAGFVAYDGIVAALHTGHWATLQPGDQV